VLPDFADFHISLKDDEANLTDLRGVRARCLT